MDVDGKKIDLPIFFVEHNGNEFLFIYGTKLVPYVIDVNGTTAYRIHFGSYNRIYKLGDFLIQRQNPLYLVGLGKAEDYNPNINITDEYFIFDLYGVDGKVIVPIKLINNLE
ncbi:MAG TPA: hypothetical protein PKV10_09485 [Thermoanaerobaculia bacterium]|nr:hypothetical protein [Thermoanaerobaculia bacterium]